MDKSACLIPSIRGTSVTLETSTGESDSGEILSPKKAPTTIAPAVTGSGTPKPWATPIKATPTVARVPQEVPAMVDISVQTTQTMGRNSPGVSTFMP